MSKWIKTGDRVLVIAGNDKGQVGEVIKKSGDRVAVKGVNVRKRHQKKMGQDGSSEILNIEVPIHISNVVHCDENGKRIKIRSKKGEKKELFAAGSDGKESLLREMRGAR